MTKSDITEHVLVGDKEHTLSNATLRAWWAVLKAHVSLSDITAARVGGRYYLDLGDVVGDVPLEAVALVLHDAQRRLFVLELHLESLFVRREVRVAPLQV